MSIIITRHGQTDWNVERKVQGKADIALNEIKELRIFKIQIYKRKISNLL